MNAALNEANEWFDRIRAQECTPAQRAEFLEWLYEDPRHGEAFAVVEKMHGRARSSDLYSRGIRYYEYS